MESDSRSHGKVVASGGCDIDIRIESQGDVNIYNCPEGGGDKEPHHECDECKPQRAEGACVPLGLGCKPKQSKRRKLEQLMARNKVPSVLAASFFQTARRFLGGSAPANDFERDVFPVFEAMPVDVRDILVCAVENFESTPSDLKYAGLEPSILADPAKPIDTQTLSTALIKEIGQRASEAVFGNPHALEAERPGLNRFYDPKESFEAQLLICQINDIRTASYRPAISLGDYRPSEIQQHCELVLVGEEVQPICQPQVGNCDGNILPDNVCARVPDVTIGDAVILTGVNFMSTDMKVRLTAKIGSSTAEVEAHVFGDLDTPLKEDVNGAEGIIRDCRVKDRLTFVVPEDLTPGVYELQLRLPNTTGIEVFGPTIFSNSEFINILPPETARFQVVAERLEARAETSPTFPGSDEVALTFLAAALLPDGTTSRPLQTLRKRFEDVDSGEHRIMESLIFSQSEEIAGMALTVIGYEVDSERAFNRRFDSFEEAFLDYLTRAWEKFNEELKKVAGAVVDEYGIKKAAIVIAIAAAIALAVMAVVAYWAPADLIMEDTIGYSVIELARLTNANAPSPIVEELESPQGLKVNVNPQEKGALTYRESREYASEEEESRYEIFFRYNRIA